MRQDKKNFITHRIFSLYGKENEIDILRIWKRKKGFFMEEIEVKTSINDLKNDFKKNGKMELLMSEYAPVNFFSYLFDYHFFEKNKETILGIVDDKQGIMSIKTLKQNNITINVLKIEKKVKN